MKSQAHLSKHAQLAVKKIAKFQDKINIIQTLIINNNINEAIQDLKTLIKGKEHLDLFPFKGLANIQNWLYQFPKGPVQWFEAAIKKNQIEGNPFDLLNVCYMIQLHLNKMTASAILSEYQKLKQGDSYKNQIKLGMANIYYYEERYLDAQRLYLELEREMDLEQNNYLLLEYISWVYEKLEVRSKAVRFCRESLILNPGNLNIKFLDIILQQDESYKQIKLIELMKEYPFYYRIYVALGDIFISDQQQEGVKYYKKALQYEPQSGYINALIAQSYYFIDKKDKALQYTKKAIKISPTCAEAYFSLALIAQSQDKLNKAEANFMQAIKLKPQNVSYHHNLGKLYHETEQYQKALQEFNIVANLNPYQADYMASIAAIYDQMNKRQECQQFYKKTLELDPNHSVALWNLGGYQITFKDNYHKANQYYIRGFQANPEDETFWMKIATCYMRLKCYQEAKQWSLKYYNSEKQEDRYQCLLLLGKVQYQLMNYENCLKRFLEYQKQTKKTDLSGDLRNVLSNLQQRMAKKLVIRLIQTSKSERPNFYVRLSLYNICMRLDMREQANQVVLVENQIQQSPNACNIMGPQQ